MLKRSTSVVAAFLVGVLALLTAGCAATGVEQSVASRYSKRPVLVYFWGTTCRACKIQDKEMAVFRQQCSLPVEKIQPSSAAIRKYNMTHYPTLILFDKGREVWRYVGIRYSDQLLRDLRPLVSAQYF